ncbi:hypothetical protein HPC49_45580 [Pyxidicoccus fallax]|uniref:Lipoxygenase domain-containing protein n=1 Tax=Pyxidicoccus fallax TaxID=394095 RepID=A0A848LZC1_9BACT|nr:lipoxygenase family protein [Pyxidicoccus fallax]NMO22971.1 hypothetical protein [Pyxidicoccus fallax]NPC85453.1 hypothetical protein [Pyxidicoccus fallax]
MWLIKKKFWNWVTTRKFSSNKVVQVPVPRESKRRLELVRLSSLIPDIPISNVWLADHIPEDERSLRTRMQQSVLDVQRRLLRLLPPMEEGLPPIDDDPKKALGEAYTRRHERLFPRPRLPMEFTPDPDLGKLAVTSPYYCYLERTAGDEYHWDFSQFRRYEHHAGLRSLAVRVLFRVEASQRRLRAVRIESDELGTTKPGDEDWPLARKLALCAATTHMSLVRHLNWIHLTGGNAIAIATRNCLPAAHPLRRLLWPHVYGTQNSNLLTIKSQLVPRGDFESIFSFTHPSLCRLLDDTRDEFDLAQLDPELDARQRGLLENGLELPTLENRRELFEVMRAHASRYLRLYYDSDDSLRRDEAFHCWVAELDRMLPRGTLALLGEEPTLKSAARLVAALIYLETVEHEVLGTCLWNYQVWTHVQPVRIYRNGQREPLDVYQRLINTNFILNVHRTPLLEDFSRLALDVRGASAMRTFREQLQHLEEGMRQQGWAAWRVTPRELEASINA